MKLSHELFLPGLPQHQRLRCSSRRSSLLIPCTTPVTQRASSLDRVAPSSKDNDLRFTLFQIPQHTQRSNFEGRLSFHCTASNLFRQRARGSSGIFSIFHAGMLNYALLPGRKRSLTGCCYASGDLASESVVRGKPGLVEDLL